MTLQVFFDPRQSVPGVDSMSPSASKPARLVQALSAQGIDHAITPVTPATREDLYLVHQKEYVDGVFAGTINNGFENRDPRVAESCLWTVGSMVCAVEHAPMADSPVFSPTSGFHHAHHAWGSGFCTFNGLMVAAAKYLQAHPASRLAILDLDYHAGDGTSAILRHNPELSERVLHHSSGFHFMERDDDPAEFWAWLHGAIAEINAFAPDVVMYQAGADMHKLDPLGGLLNDAEMMLRDRRVFTGIQAPIAWNLAGGYRGHSGSGLGDPVIRTHLRTAIESIKRKYHPS